MHPCSGSGSSAGQVPRARLDDVLVGRVEHVLVAVGPDEAAQHRARAVRGIGPLAREPGHGGERRRAAGHDEPGPVGQRVGGPVGVDERDDAGRHRAEPRRAPRRRRRATGSSSARAWAAGTARTTASPASPPARRPRRASRRRAPRAPTCRAPPCRPGRRAARRARRAAPCTPAARPLEHRRRVAAPRRGASPPAPRGSATPARAPTRRARGTSPAPTSRSTSPAYRPPSSGAIAAVGRLVAEAPPQQRAERLVGGVLPRADAAGRGAPGAGPAPRARASGTPSPGRPGSRTPCPTGTARGPSGVQSHAPLDAGATRSSPSSRHRSTAHGFRATNESGPAGHRTPPTSTSASMPPGRSAASRTATSTAGSRSSSRCATVRPATPPPTTTTRATSRLRPGSRPGGRAPPSASTSQNTGSALGIRVRANGMPASRAASAASMSRS